GRQFPASSMRFGSPARSTQPTRAARAPRGKWRQLSAPQKAGGEKLGEDFAERGDRPQCVGLRQTRPPHAHDKVVYSEQRVIALNFVGYERLIADNKAILDKLLERLPERL